MTTLSQMPEAIQDFLETHKLTNTEALTSETPASLQQALAAVADLVMQNFAELAGQLDNRQVLWNAAREAAAASPTTAPSKCLIKSVLDDRYHGTASTVARETGVTPATVTHLIDLEEAAALAIMGNLTSEQNWNAQQLSEWLRPRRYAPVVTPAVAASAATMAPIATSRSWFASPANALLVAVSIIAVGEFGYILSTRSGESSEVATATAPNTNNQYKVIPASSISPSRTSASEKAAVPVVLKLKDGVRQVIGATSTESKLYQFLIDPGKEVDVVDPTKGWIGFDRIYFESSKAILTNESLWQLSNVASILKRFPEAKIKIGGYTDASGNPLNNLKLSADRANAAKDALVSLGVAPERLAAVGYGVLDNIASNDTEEGRALNRRVSLQVTQK